MELGERATAIVVNQLAAKHRRAANARGRVAKRLMEAAAYWSERGERERAILEVRAAILEQQLAQLERDRAELAERLRARSAEKTGSRAQFGSAYVRR
jgi:hypothetical protein